MSVTDGNIIVFVRLEMDGADDVKVHTGLGSPFYKDSPWYEYVGVGSLLALSNARDTRETTASNFTITLSVPQDESIATERVDLLAKAREEDLLDNGVAIYIWEQGATDEPRLLMLSQVETATITATGTISLRCYTPAAQLTHTRYAPTIHSDLQQTQIVDATDRSLRFSNRSYADAGISYP